MAYSDGNGAWSMMRLKKELLQEFPQLKEKRSNFNYVVILPASYADLKKMVGKMEKKQQVTPMLFFFCRRKKDIDGK